MLTTQQEIGASVVQQVTLENFLGKTPSLARGVFTGKEFSAFELSPKLINRHGPPVDLARLPHGSYQTTGSGIIFPNGFLYMPLVPLPNQAQAAMTIAIPDSSNGMTSTAHASLQQWGQCSDEQEKMWSLLRITWINK